MTIYATHDSDGLAIAIGAQVRAFATLQDAEAWLRSPYEGGDWNLDTLQIAEGHFSDCWRKTHAAPDLRDFGPFAPDDLRVAGPGQHPGGRQWWVTPYPDVLVVASVQER